ncbi:MAG: hypothetical protein LPK80_11695 [Bacteroidota bacterium]|nr:hypothetical protein [Bacteroidota bacterium]MDX5429169.1 hypothetical protein [Bacteroidota bacterium]MDX5506807.1 hypothetical protein [Bacteroidota bacterium]
MSFGGHVQAMISSLRLNQRKRQSYFVQRESQRKKVLLDPQKVAQPTAKEMEEIRKKIVKQKKRDLILWILILPPSILITYLLLNYLIG